MNIQAQALMMSKIRMPLSHIHSAMRIDPILLAEIRELSLDQALIADNQGKLILLAKMVQWYDLDF